jgi:hypothetical protein
MIVLVYTCALKIWQPAQAQPCRSSRPGVHSPLGVRPCDFAGVPGKFRGAGVGRPTVVPVAVQALVGNRLAGAGAHPEQSAVAITTRVRSVARGEASMVKTRAKTIQCVGPADLRAPGANVA